MGKLNVAILTGGNVAERGISLGSAKTVFDHLDKSKYQSYIKRAWAIYALITIALIVILVLFVAKDTEERFFFTIMPAAAAYVLRPSNRYLGNLIFKLNGAFFNPLF